MWKEDPGDDMRAAASSFLSHLASRHCSVLTIRAYRSDLAAFCAFLESEGIREASAVARQHVLAFTSRLQGFAPATIRRRVAAIGSLFRYLQDCGEVTHNPAHHLPLPRKVSRIPVVLSRDEIATIIRACRPDWLRCSLILLRTTGVRRAELIGICLQDVDFDEATLLVRGKGAKERIVPLKLEAIQAIRDYLPRRVRHRGEHLLVNEQGRPITGARLFRALRLAAWRAGITRPVTPHLFRHTFATELVRSGTDLRTIQELLGHENLETTARYLHSDLRTKRAAVEGLADLVNPSQVVAGYV